MMRLAFPLYIATPAYWRQRAYLASIAAVAQSHIGVSQELRGEYGTDVCSLLKDAPGVDCDRYEAWCQRFVWVCAETAARAKGGATVYPHAWGGVARAWLQSGTLGLQRLSHLQCDQGELPGIGWVMIRTRDPARRSSVLRGGSAPGHCGVVVETIGTTHVATVDGNTNSSGSATGGEVGRNVVSLRDPRLVGFIRPEMKSV